MKQMNLEQAVQRALEGKSLKNVTIDGHEQVKVSAKQALILYEHNIVFPEENIYYNDEDIAYDPEFDEVEWSDEPLEMSWEEKAELFANVQSTYTTNEIKSIQISLPLKNERIESWAKENQTRLTAILSDLVESLYAHEQD